jgi:methylthioribose-1-phosphate isomerase
VRFIDQTKLPTQEVYVTCKTYGEVADAIKTMIVRGAPAIGVSAAMGIALGVRDSKAETAGELAPEFEQICQVLGATRPTAVNLFWAIRRMQNKFAELRHQPVAEIKREMVDEAQRIYVEDIAANEAMGKHGAVLLPSSGSVLTHCNAGALCAAGYGTALGVIRAAVESGKQIHVFADETRPFLQGSRLTAWELMKDNIPTTLISDNMAGAIMRQGKINAVVDGADRIAANGDVANKIGTYTVAILAKEHGIPFYVAAPLSTIDLQTTDGSKIPIEQRSPTEVTHMAGKQIAPDGVGVENPAFDVTPHEYVSAIITERGVARAPYGESLKALFQE